MTEEKKRKPRRMPQLPEYPVRYLSKHQICALEPERTVKGYTGAGSYIYFCTRMRVRATHLYPREVYLRLLNMSLPEITRFISESEYRREINQLSSTYTGIDLIEEALTANLAWTFRKILRIAPGYLRVLTIAYLNKWDVVNVMTILRGRSQNLATGRIRALLIPAGELDFRFLDTLLQESSLDAIIEELHRWRLYPFLVEDYRSPPEKGMFARMENNLFRQFYSDFLCGAATGLKGGDILLEYVRFEIDLVNVKNLLRIRREGVEGDVSRFMVPGGNITVTGLQELHAIECREEFVGAFRKTSICPVLRVAMQELRSVPVSEEEAAEQVWERWRQKKAPIHEVEMAVTRVRLDRMARMAKRYPFSVIPVLLYLEKKKYEVYNLRAITRGCEFGISPGKIRKFLVT